MSTIPPIGSVPDVVTNTLIATDWGNSIGAASKGRVVQRFNTPAERDAAITAPVKGMLCYVLSTDVFYGYRTTGGWTALIGGPRDTTHCRVWRNGAWNSNAGSGITIIFDTVDFDPLSMYNAGTGNFTVPVAGVYLFTSLVSVTWVSGNAGEIQAERNGVYFSAGNATNNQSGYGRNRAALVATVKCAAGDTLRIKHFTAPGACAGNTGAGDCWAAVDYLGTG